MTDEVTEASVVYTVGVGEMEGWLTQVIRATDGTTEPACELIVRIRPDYPNSYAEWSAIQDLLTEATQRMLGEVLDVATRKMAAAHPEHVSEAALSVLDSLEMAGFPLEHAAEAAMEVLDDLGGEASR